MNWFTFYYSARGDSGGANDDKDNNNYNNDEKYYRNQEDGYKIWLYQSTFISTYLYQMGCSMIKCW